VGYLEVKLQSGRRKICKRSALGLGKGCKTEAMQTIGKKKNKSRSGAMAGGGSKKARKNVTGELALKKSYLIG